jgi:tetratricopeptide (TPR) repeat protein
MSRCLRILAPLLAICALGLAKTTFVAAEANGAKLQCQQPICLFEAATELSDGSLARAGAASGLAALGEIDRAAKIARSITYTLHRVIALTRVAVASHSRGDKKLSDDLINEAIATLDHDPLKVTLDWQYPLIAMVESGRDHDATAVISQRVNQMPPLFAPQVLTYLATGYHDVGNDVSARVTIHKSLDLALSIEDEPQRSWALHDIAELQLKMGDVEAALETARRITSLGKLIFVPLDRPVGVGSLPADGFRDPLYSEIASWQARHGLFDDAMTTARLIDGQAAAYGAYLSIARLNNPHSASACVARLSAVVSAIRSKIVDIGVLARALADLSIQVHRCGADELARGLLVQSIALVNDIRNSFDREAAISAVGNAYANFGEFTQAIAFIGRIRNAAMRRLPLYEVGKIAQRLGHPEATFAIAASYGMEDDFNLYFASVRANAKRFGEAITFASAVKLPDWRAQAYVEIGRKMLLASQPSTTARELSAPIAPEPSDLD